MTRIMGRNGLLTDDLAGAAAPATIRHITTDDLRGALRQGWADFLAIPTQLVFLCVLYPIVGLVLARVGAGDALLPLVWPLVAGLSLVGPVAAVGLYEISRKREAGAAVSWLTAFDVLRSPNFPAIGALGLLLMGIFLAWVGVARAIYGATLGALPLHSIGAIIEAAFTTPQGFRLLLLGNGAGFLFALLVLVLTVVSVPMLLDRNVSLGTAIATSVEACRRNPGPMAVWGIIVAGALLLGSIPAFIGLAVVMPVLGHSTWHLYRRVVA